MFHTEDPEILSTAVQNVVATANWRQEFVCPCIKEIKFESVDWI